MPILPVCYTFLGATTTSCGTMYGIASSSAQISQSLTDTGTLVALVIVAIAGGAIALMGLGFLFKHIRKWITGRKF